MLTLLPSERRGDAFRRGGYTSHQQLIQLWRHPECERWEEGGKGAGFPFCTAMVFSNRLLVQWLELRRVWSHSLAPFLGSSELPSENQVLEPNRFRISFITLTLVTLQTGSWQHLQSRMLLCCLGNSCETVRSFRDKQNSCAPEKQINTSNFLTLVPVLEVWASFGLVRLRSPKKMSVVREGAILNPLRLSWWPANTNYLLRKSPSCWSVLRCSNRTPETGNL